MKIGILTSSRADFGIYQPLLAELKHQNVDIHIIAFGMHMMGMYGNTINQIKKGNYGTVHELAGLTDDDSPMGINQSYAHIIESFSRFWNKNSFDKVIALGDRFEMNAAVQSTIPFEIYVCHIHGGETTLGATDNIYRHQITLAASLHFAASAIFATKINSLKPENSNSTYNVGALSLDNLLDSPIPSWHTVTKEFSIPNVPFVLITVHPETVGLENNNQNIKQFIGAVTQILSDIHLIITMPNADSYGKMYREAFIKLKTKHPENVSIIETFGKLNYFSAMKNAKYLLGNTSSGIIEAASFGKYVINVGDRQKGRLRSKNVIDASFNKKEILAAISKIEKTPVFNGGNLYKQDNTAKKIVEKLLNEKL